MGRSSFVGAIDQPIGIRFKFKKGEVQLVEKVSSFLSS